MASTCSPQHTPGVSTPSTLQEETPSSQDALSSTTIHEEDSQFTEQDPSTPEQYGLEIRDFPAARTTPPVFSKHTTWTATTFAMAKCDCCELQRRLMIQCCNKCSFSICRDCYNEGKLQANKLHEMDHTVKWEVDGDQKSKAYMKTKSSRATRSNPRGRGGRGRIAKSRAPRGRGRGRGRGGSRLRHVSLVEGSSPESTVDSPMSDIGLTSDNFEEDESATPIEKDSHATYSGTGQDCHVRIRDEDEDLTNNYDDRYAAAILAGLPHATTPTYQIPQAPPPTVLRYNGLQYGLLDQNGHFISTPHPRLPWSRSIGPPPRSEAPGTLSSTPRIRRFQAQYGSNQEAGQTNCHPSHSPQPQHMMEATTISPDTTETYTDNTDVETDNYFKSLSDPEEYGKTNRKSPGRRAPVIRPSPQRFNPYSRPQPHSRSTRAPQTDKQPITVSSNAKVVLPDSNPNTTGQWEYDSKDKHDATESHNIMKRPSLSNPVLEHHGTQESALTSTGSTGQNEQELMNRKSSLTPQQPIRHPVNIQELSRNLQLAAQGAHEAYPEISLDQCLCDEVAWSWNNGTIHSIAASTQDHSTEPSLAAFNVALAATYYACTNLRLDEQNLARDWLYALEQSLKKEENETVGQTA